MKLFIVVDIGCLECGQASNILAVKRTREAAKRILEQVAQSVHRDLHGKDYLNEGDHLTEIFEGEYELD